MLVTCGRGHGGRASAKSWASANSAGSNEAATLREAMCGLVTECAHQVEGAASSLGRDALDGRGVSQQSVAGETWSQVRGQCSLLG